MSQQPTREHLLVPGRAFLMSTALVERLMRELGVAADAAVAATVTAAVAVCMEPVDESGLVSDRATP